MKSPTYLLNVSRAQQFKFNGKCILRGVVTLRWSRVPFFFAGLVRSVRGLSPQPPLAAIQAREHPEY